MPCFFSRITLLGICVSPPKLTCAARILCGKKINPVPIEQLVLAEKGQ
jgi:hypothetical protein